MAPSPSPSPSPSSSTFLSFPDMWPPILSASLLERGAVIAIANATSSTESLAWVNYVDTAILVRRSRRCLREVQLTAGAVADDLGGRDDPRLDDHLGVQGPAIDHAYAHRAVFGAFGSHAWVCFIRPLRDLQAQNCDDLTSLMASASSGSSALGSSCLASDCIRAHRHAMD
jgi:hypothetical protein